MTIHAIVGGQFGSEAKGHVAAQLTAHYRDLGHDQYLVRVGGSNAGHSAVDSTGRVWALRQVPAAAVIDPKARLVIAEGSEIDVSVLEDEINQLDAAGFNVSARLWIDPMATIIEPHHIELESGSDINARTGSTAKGVGASRADRIMRKAKVVRDIKSLADFKMPTAALLHGAYYNNEFSNIIIEGTQGYGLGLHTQQYPQTTSGNCRTVDLLAQVGFTPLDPRRRRDVYTWVVFRTYPIRVAGNSGPLQNETTWEALSEKTGGYIQPERTTVTKKIRRVGYWDSTLAQKAIIANGGTGEHINACLMFVDYLDPKLAGQTDVNLILNDFTPGSARSHIVEMQESVGRAFAMFGTSASTVMWNHEAIRIPNWQKRK